MFTMPLAPLIVNRTSGDWMWTAASVLSLRSQKLEFDPALSKDFDNPDNEDARVNGLSMLERYVGRLLDASFVDSSLFWHYAMRHVPSQSLMCVKDYSSSNYKPANTKVQFTNNVNIPSDASNPSITTKVPTNGIPMYGYGAFPIGGHTTSCFCGWTKASATTCEIPATICKASVAPDASGVQCRWVLLVH
jgi:hypothetical protein